MATKFITVSIEIMHDRNLTPNQKFILAEIHQLSQLDKGCIASNRHFSELTGIKVQAVSNAINDLCKKGYIDIDNSNTKRNFGRIITIHSDVYAIHSDVESKGNKTNNASFTSEEEKTMLENEFQECWKNYTLGFLKSFGRQGGRKTNARDNFIKLRKKYSYEEIKSLVENHKLLSIGYKDLERILTIDMMKQFIEDGGTEPQKKVFYYE